MRDGGEEKRIGYMHQRMSRRMANGVVGGEDVLLRDAEEGNGACASSDVCVQCVGEMEEEVKAKQLEQLAKEASSVEAELRRSRFETSQLEMVKAANEDEIRRLKDKISDASITIRDQQIIVDSQAGLQKELVALESGECKRRRRRVKRRTSVGWRWRRRAWSNGGRHRGFWSGC